MPASASVSVKYQEASMSHHVHRVVDCHPWLAFDIALSRPHHMWHHFTSWCAYRRRAFHVCWLFLASLHLRADDSLNCSRQPPAFWFMTWLQPKSPWRLQPLRQRHHHKMGKPSQTRTEQAIYQTVQAWKSLLSSPYPYATLHFTQKTTQQGRKSYSHGQATELQKDTRKRRRTGELVGTEARIFGVAAMLDIRRMSVRGSIKAHSSIYRRHQRSARTKPAL